MKNNIDYSDDHWSTTLNPKLGLEKYLKQYELIYNISNIKRLIEVIDGKQLKILDYGGGCGILSVTLAKLGHKVTLIDASEPAIKTALFYASQEGVKIEAKAASRLDSECFENKFDIIFAKDLIEHVIDDRALVHGFSEVLENNGLLIMTTQNSLSLNYIFEGGIRKIFRPKGKWMGWDRTHLRFYTPSKLRELVEINGFTLVRFSSAYIFPYKLVSILLPFMNPHKKSIFSEFDGLLSKVHFLSKFGWNIMVIATKH